jgi:hypothetical protein
MYFCPSGLIVPDTGTTRDMLRTVRIDSHVSARGTDPLVVK